MENYLIYCDTAADLDEEVIRQADIRFIPMEYSLGDEMRVCMRPESPEILKQFYNGQRGGDLTRTSQISPEKYVYQLSPVLREGRDVLYLALSSGLSSTYQSAALAAAELKEKFPEHSFVPVDTLSATGGMDVICERAIRNRAAGMSIEENAADLRDLCGRVAAWFFVDDLQYLKRGGRVSAATAAVGTILQMKPILRITPDGKLETIGKERGGKAALKELLRRFTANDRPGTGDVIYVVDADNREQAEQLAEAIRAIRPDAEIRHATVSPIIGAHTGPGLVGVCHVVK